jgi:recombination protein RecT
MGLPATIAKVETLRDILSARMSAFREVLPRHVTAERLVRLACSAASREPKLLLCTTRSVLMSMMTAAQLGLEPGVLGHAFLVPFENRKNGTVECQLIPGYRGLIDLARRTGQLAAIGARVVYEEDVFEVDFGEEKILHRPNLRGEKRGTIIAAYMRARLKDGEPQIEVMTMADILAIKARSQSGRYDKGPWSTDFGEMARKTVVRRGCKYLPSSVELAAAVDLDIRHEIGESQTGVLDIPGLESEPEAPLLETVPEESTAERVKKKVARKVSVKREDGAEMTTPAECRVCGVPGGHQPGCPEEPEALGGKAREPGGDDE